MWRASVPSPNAIKLLHAAREAHNLTPLAIHCSYLINLASTDTGIRRKSIAAFAGELERAEAIGAEYLVLHPGANKTVPLEDAVALVAAAIEEATRAARPKRVTLLLENTVGAGGQLGARFEDLAALARHAQHTSGLTTAYCLDTCHLLGAGFELRTAAGLKATLSEAEATLGLDNVRLIHTNDSKGTLGSKVDRHENIGEGEIGLPAFRRILTHPLLRDKPFILETPVENEGDDRRNVQALWAVSRRTRTPLAKRSPAR